MRVAVLGTGLIGGSILTRLLRSGIDATGWDPDPGTVSYAREHAIPFAERLPDAVDGRDVVFLAGPLSLLPDTLAEVVKHADTGCVVTDVGSVKAPIAEYARDNGWAHRFVPGHPMAGTERSGLAAADPDLFVGAAWVLCPQPGVPLDPFRRLSGLVTTALGAKVVPLAPRTHDAIVALSSHIPHLLAGSLAGAVARSALREGVLSLAAGSFRDGTRVAGTPSVRTVDMLVNNRDAIGESLRLVQAFLAELAEALAGDDVAALTGAFDEARGVRRELFERSTRTSTDRFPRDAAAEEYEFLVKLGADGGHLTGCAVDGSTVSYTAARPVTG
ncbi:prephenate dehydrogenase/arogenate dehydrogenase family protein [Planosporangium thailandense]|uniref:Prephenate dehydrogenase/arogenate dehydrogenase family protein n=1 Tax=Planosporangium thailandense TaxID=765197 RepID=A0ABX0XWB2_9ACTN|nr:prephenate dehydrogenase/arogenate dehydrogenase family protein [Planosporangium thailandense]NJC69549.1 prephenate dehydrogenase/arogenate dehydrogenase family protein [Planosporangium thailandense]